MNETLKEVVERAMQQRQEKLERDKIAYKLAAVESAEKQREKDDAEYQLACEWLDNNLLTMIEAAIMNGDNRVRISRFEWPKGLSYSISCEMLARAVNSVDGLTATFEPAEKMTNYPTFDEIIITWDAK